MRRYLFVFLFVVVLVAPFVLRAAMGVRSSESLGTGSAAEPLVIVTPHNQDIRREFARAFRDWHLARYGQAVQIDYRTPGGTNDIKRLLVTTYDGYRDKSGKLPKDLPTDIDMAWGGGDFFFDVELPRDILQPIALDPKLLEEAFPEKRLAGVKLIDCDAQGQLSTPPQWIGICLSSFGIVYNPDLYGALGLSAPQGWGDMTDARLAGMVALADPTHSGSAAVAYMMVLQRAMADAEAEILQRRPDLAAMTPADRNKDSEYKAAIERGWKQGMSQLLLIAANARYFTDSASQVPNDVGNGEAAVGMAIDFYGLVYQDSVGAHRCTFVSPKASTAITPDPIGILYGVKGPKLELATHFVEFLLTPEAQRLWILNAGEPGGPQQRSLRRPPIRPDVYADRTGWPDIANPYESASGFNQRADWMGLFGDVRPLWAAAWIDSREALKSAHEAVLRAEPRIGREKMHELRMELADLPIEMSDVARLRSQRGKVQDIERLQRERGRIESVQDLEQVLAATTAPAEDPQRQKIAKLKMLLEEMNLTGRTPVNAEEWKARQRIEWANRFREHYARVAEKAKAG